MSDLRKAQAVREPSIAQLRDAAQKSNLDLTDQELELYKKQMAGFVKSYNIVAGMAEEPEMVKYPRTMGYRPRDQDNPLNAWAWRAEIHGATSGKLLGKTVAIKDNTQVAGLPMMNGSRILEGYIPETDATVVRRLLDAGARITGKANCEDLCFRCVCDVTTILPQRRQPHLRAGPGAQPSGQDPHGRGQQRRQRGPGDVITLTPGEDDVTVLQVAAGDVDMALGGDQGGSVRIPASWCGIVGLKPTHGLVPYTGAMPIETTVDHLGPMARDVTTVALMLELTGDLKGVRVGVLKEGMTVCDEEVQDVVVNCGKRMRKAGAIVEEVSIPAHAQACDVWMPIGMEGAFEIMLRSGGVTLGTMGACSVSLSQAVQRGLKTHSNDMSNILKTVTMFGQYIRDNYSHVYYGKAVNLAKIVTKKYDEVLANYDVLIMPTLPHVATTLPTETATFEDGFTKALTMIPNTAPFDVTHHPAVTLPVGKARGLPVGMQLVGKHWGEADLLRIAHAVEKMMANNK